MFKKQNPWRFPADFRPRLFVVRGSFFQLFGLLFGVFSGSGAPLGQLGFQPWIWLGFWFSFWYTFGSLFCFLADAIFNDFRCFPRPLFFQLSLKMHAFREPTASSGDTFSKVFVTKAKSRKVTFCLDRTPYIEIRGSSDRSVASVFSTPALREAPPMEKESRNHFPLVFRVLRRPVWAAFRVPFCSPEKNCEKRPNQAKNRKATSSIFTNIYIYIYIWSCLFCLLTRSCIRNQTTDRFGYSRETNRKWNKVYGFIYKTY